MTVTNNTITGVSGNVSYSEGNYAPVITLAEGDYFDMMSYIVNPGLEDGTIDEVNSSKIPKYHVPNEYHIFQSWFETISKKENIL